jgi:hypothetical protein
MWFFIIFQYSDRLFTPAVYELFYKNIFNQQNHTNGELSDARLAAVVNLIKKVKPPQEFSLNIPAMQNFQK